MEGLAMQLVGCCGELWLPRSGRACMVHGVVLLDQQWALLWFLGGLCCWVVAFGFLRFFRLARLLFGPAVLYPVRSVLHTWPSLCRLPAICFVPPLIPAHNGGFQPLDPA